MKLNYAARTMLSFFSFNIGWLACALGASHGYPWVGPVTLPIFVGVHLYYSPVSKGETVFLALLATLGFCLDTFFIQVGFFTIYPEVEFAPLWLVAMWVLLGQTYESLLMMKRNKWLLVLSGAFSGPLSYYCFEALGILIYRRPLWLSLVLHAIFWGALTPALLKLREWTLRLTCGASGQVEVGPAAEFASAHADPRALEYRPATPNPPDKP